MYAIGPFIIASYYTPRRATNVHFLSSSRGEATNVCFLDQCLLKFSITLTSLIISVLFHLLNAPHQYKLLIISIFKVH